MEHGFVAATFEGNPKFYFFKNTLEGLSIGDVIVVETMRGFQVVTVMDLPESVDRHVGSWVVDKVDMQRFVNIKAIRQTEKEQKARKMELKRKMKALFDKKALPLLIEEYAEKDEEMAKLLTEYKSL